MVGKMLETARRARIVKDESTAEAYPTRTDEVKAAQRGRPMPSENKSVKSVIESREPSLDERGGEDGQRSDMPAGGRTGQERARATSWNDTRRVDQAENLQRVQTGTRS